MNQNDLVAKILATLFAGKRRLVAIAGPPASGKSTLACELAQAHPSFALVPMDGFHLDNATLKARNRLDRKGAPDTFVCGGFLGLVTRSAGQSIRTLPQI